MKQLLTFSPIFVPGPAGQGYLDFSMYPNFDINKVYAVIDLTANTPIYIPGAPGLGLQFFTNAAGGQNSAADDTIIYLQTDTSKLNSTDSLNVYYETNSGFENNTPLESGGMLEMMMENTAQILRELIVMNYILAEGLNVRREDVSQMRQDVTVPSNSEYTNTSTW